MSSDPLGHRGSQEDTGVAYISRPASGRVPPGIATGDVITSWLNPTSILGGVIAVGVCAYLAAVYLCADAQQHHDLPLVEYFRIRAIATAVLLGAIALAGIAVLRADAPQLFDGLISRGLALIVASVVTGIGSIVLLVHSVPAQPVRNESGSGTLNVTAQLVVAGQRLATPNHEGL